jgi:hypothetical protein
MRDAGYALPGVGMIPLRSHSGWVRAWAIVDLADFAVVRRYRWHFSGGYARRNVYSGGQRSHIELMARFLLGVQHGDAREVDHRDRNTLNNRRSNLRVVPFQAQNVTPQQGRSSRYRGVDWHRPSQKWRARVRCFGTLRHLGMFDDEDEAARVASAFRLAHLPYAVD